LWTQIFFLPLLLAILYLILLAVYSPYSKDAYGDVESLTRAMLVSVPLLYIAKLPYHIIKKSLVFVVFLLILLTIFILYTEIENIGYIRILNLEGFFLKTNRNQMGSIFAISAIYCFILNLHNKKNNFYFIAAVSFFLMVGFINNSRGAFFATIAVFLIILACYDWRAFLKKAIMALPIIFLFYIFCLGKDNTIYHGGSFDNGRMDIWRVYVEEFMNAPLLGHGLRGYIDNYALLLKIPEPLPNYPHSIYISLLYETGVITWFFWFFWFFWVARRIYHTALLNGDKFMWSLGVGVSTYILIHGLVDFNFYLFGVFVALLVGLFFIFMRIDDSEISLLIQDL
jgi:O-antigen ligase